MSQGNGLNRALVAHEHLVADLAAARHRFIAELSHEVRSALTVVTGNADMLLMTNPELEGRVQPIVVAAERIDAIMQTLLEAAENEIEADVKR